VFFDADRLFQFTAAPITNEGTLSAINRGWLRIANLAAPNTGTVSAAVDTKIEFTGAFAQSAGGTTHVDIGGTASTAFGFIAVTGAATLAGTFDVQFASGFTPAVGNRFQVLNYGSKTGVFDSIHVTGLGSGLVVTPEYNGTNMTLVVSAAPPGSVPLQQDGSSSQGRSTSLMADRFEQLAADSAATNALLATKTTDYRVANLTALLTKNGRSESSHTDDVPSDIYLPAKDASADSDISAATDEVFESLGKELLLMSI
jgi:hypothetical protein